MSVVSICEHPISHVCTMGISTENNFQISIRAKTKGFNLRVRLKGNFFTSPILKARHLSGSLSARARGLTVYFKLGLLQALGTATPTSNSTSVVRYSLRVHVRKLWMKMKGNYMQGDQRDFAPKTKPSLEKTPSLKKTKASNKKIYWYRLFPGKKNIETKTLLEGPARGVPGYLAPYIDDYTRMERVVMVPQGIGVVCTFIVLAQLVNAGGLPLFVIVVTGLAVSGQFVLKNYGTCICPRVQQLWQDAIGIGGLSVLPQTMQVMFGSRLPQYDPTEIAIGGFIMILFLLVRYGRPPEKFVQLFGLISPWTTVSLFLWAPVTQLWSAFGAQTTFSRVQLFAGLLAILSNCVQIPLLNSTKHSHSR